MFRPLADPREVLQRRHRQPLRWSDAGPTRLRPPREPPAVARLRRPDHRGLYAAAPAGVAGRWPAARAQVTVDRAAARARSPCVGCRPSLAPPGMPAIRADQQADEITFAGSERPVVRTEFDDYAVTMQFSSSGRRPACSAAVSRWRAGDRQAALWPMLRAPVAVFRMTLARIAVSTVSITSDRQSPPGLLIG
jgi:hypothetical protein